MVVQESFLMPTYASFVTDVSYALGKSWSQLERNDLTPAGWFHSLKTHGSCHWNDGFWIVLCAVTWTVLRSLITKYFFQEIIRRSRLSKKAEKGVPECLWNLTFSLMAWIPAAYLVLHKYDLFSNPVRTITDWQLHSVVNWDIYCIYMFQISHYLHCIYATLVLEEWRKDSVVMLIHHLVSIILIVNSYLFRYVHLGMLVLFLHDLNDVFLQATKLAVYYKSKGGTWATVCDVLSSVGFVLFGTSWFVFRLYWFPLKVIYVSAYVSREMYHEEIPPFYFFTNGLLLTLFILHIYWFKFILVMAYKVVTGAAKEVSDEREYQNGGNDKNVKTAVRNGLHNKTD
ncbi:unnamed protein product [Clavelina lepadiformis]|uniref:TLC domain-containing protein n=1 Tax=Clavelina lepadiformis TaxID=159417 RepID=A0ABP0FGR2_CLALP